LNANVGCHANGVRFPHLYRVIGFEYDLIYEGTNNARFVPRSTVPVEPFYTLSEIDESLDFTDLGDHQLKNIVQPVRVYRIEPLANRGYLAFNETPNRPQKGANIGVPRSAQGRRWDRNSRAARFCARSTGRLPYLTGAFP
jgi:hypothetical protein